MDCKKGNPGFIAQGNENRKKIETYIHEHPFANNVEISAALDIGVTTVGRHRRALKESFECSEFLEGE